MNQSDSSPQLKPYQIWILFISGFLMASACVLAVATIPLLGQSLLFDHLNDAGHVLVFWGVTIVVYVGTRFLKLRPIQRFLVAIGLSGGLGALIEAVQHFVPGRTASVQDLLRDGIGILIGLCCIVICSKSMKLGKRTFRRVLFGGIAAILLLIGLRDVIWVLQEYQKRNQGFPVLVDAETRWWDTFVFADNLDFWRSSAPHDWPNRDYEVLNLKFYPTKFSTFGLRDPYPDWTSKKHLEFDLLSRSKNVFNLHVRIHDWDHAEDYFDRYNGIFQIKPGFQTIQIPIKTIQNAPATNPLDLKQIAGVYLFTTESNDTKHVLFNKLRLVD